MRGARRLEMCHTGARCAGCSSHAPVGAGSVSERGGSSTGGSSPDWTRSSNSLAGPSGKPKRRKKAGVRKTAEVRRGSTVSAPCAQSSVLRAPRGDTGLRIR